jgi:hypothetical protein
MEVLSDWYLNLRTESDLFRIASDADIDKEMVSVDKEILGVNLFLKIRKSQKPPGFKKYNRIRPS